MSQSPEWHAANKRENELYRHCHADPLRANWQELFDAMKRADALRQEVSGQPQQRS